MRMSRLNLWTSRTNICNKIPIISGRCNNNVSRRSLSSSRLFLYSDEVRSAIANKEPIVAFESTIVAHGMPYPTNFQVATNVETLVRNVGVTPATIAIHQGRPKIGLSPEELQDLAKTGATAAMKCSTRDLSILLGQHHSSQSQPSWGATTVASTMVLAHAAASGAIATFVTGGIGGVHRKAELTMDISTDLTELSRTPIVVVSAGIKSILDIRKTLEVLETLGVPVLTFRSNEFPAFFHAASGIDSPARVDNATDIANYYHSARQLQLQHGMLIAVPPPVTNFQHGVDIESAIQAALIESEQLEISGRDLTPFLLKRVAEQTKGDSLAANVALVMNNAKVGADIAIAIANQENQQPIFHHIPSTLSPRIVVMGGAVIDMIAKPKELLQLHTSNPGAMVETNGGVGRNIAETLTLLGTPVLFLTAVGDDDRGQRLLQQNGEGTRVIQGQRTATYLSILNDTGDLHTAVADMDILSYIPAPTILQLQHASHIILDGNASRESLEQAIQHAIVTHTAICFEPTSVPKATAVMEWISHIQYAFPNRDECIRMAMELMSTLKSDAAPSVEEAATIVLNAMAPNANTCLIVTLGSDGVLLGCKTMNNPEITWDHIPAKEGVVVVNSTGAGDSLCGAFVHALINGKNEKEAVEYGMEAAVLSLQCADRAVSLENLNLKL